MYHYPVLLHEMIKELNVQEGALYFDGTFGGGGYSKAILDKKGCVIALDCDPEAQMRANRLEGDLKFHLGKLSEISSLVHEAFDGAVFDFGVSSFQLDTKDRGFSFQLEGPLDMRMSKNGISAFDVVNTFNGEDLTKIIATYGEEPKAKTIANLIIKNRPLYTTKDLALLIEKNIRKHSKLHPATLTFQAIRIFVNNELQEIYDGLMQIFPLIKHGSKLLCVTFHGLEDRVLKDFEKQNHIKAHKIIRPSKEEIKQNRRSRSAKLKIYIKNS